MTRPPTPVLDSRRAGDVLTELIDHVPGYSAYWRPRPGSSGMALLSMVSRFSELVSAAVNGAVDKGKLAFLDAFGIDMLPPQAARAPLVFQLAPDSPVDPSLPQGTEAAVQLVPALPKSIAPPPQAKPSAQPDPLVFATEAGIALARARLSTLYSTYPDVDKYADHSAQLTSGFLLYDSMQPVVHHLYVGHDSLLALAGSVDVSLDFNLSSDMTPAGTTKSGKPKQPRGLKLAWEYLTQGGWIPFDPVDDHTYGLSHEGEVQLRKRTGAPSSQGAVDQMSSFWLRTRLETPLPYFGSKDQPRLPIIDSIRIRLNLKHGSLACDVAFGDDLRLDTSKDFLPLGGQPGISSSFLVACDQAFQHEGARIGINVTFTSGVIPEPTSDLALFWEYSVAPGIWQPLGVGDTEFHDNTANFTKPTTVDPSISFLRPADWAKVSLNGEEHFWLRVRVAQGGFGGPTTYSVVNDGGNWKVVASNEPHPPQLSTIKFSYAYQIGPFIPDHCLALNGFAYEDFTDACRWGRMPFRPFSPLPDRYSAVYFGFDKPLPVGLASLYVDVAGSAGTAVPASPYLWEYKSPDGWVELPVLDETAGFAQSGLVRLIGPADAVSSPGPSGPTYWIRARTRDAIDPEPSPVSAIYLNAIWATQRKPVQGEVLGRSDGTPRQALLAQHAPILERQVLEVQEWSGTGREWESLFAGLPPGRTRYEKDPRGNVTAVWVTWEDKPYLYGSTARDRHYTLERTRGLVRFGNGFQGMVPPPGAILMLSYNFGGGVDGNVPPQMISQLHSGVPYFQQVFNPVAAAGGAAGETVDEVRLRGPQRIKNAGRSVAQADYEWLARESSPEVAVARCLQATGPHGDGEPGWVTVVIVPYGIAREPAPSQQLLRRVQAALRSAAPAAIAAQVRVIGATFRPISIQAEIVPQDPSQAAELEENVAGALDAYLNPVTGGESGAGWDFGQTVHLSGVVQVILSVEGVASAPHVALVSGTQVFGDFVPVPADALPSAGNHLLKLRVAVA